MTRLRIYLDTSVLSALIDQRAPDRLGLTGLLSPPEI